MSPPAPKPPSASAPHPAAPSEILPIVSLGGALVPAAEARISAFDRGFQLGDGIFDTVHVVEGVPIALEAHLLRFERSVAFFRIRGVPEREALVEQIGALIAANGLSAAASARTEHALRITVSRGVRPGGPATVVLHLRTVAPEHLAKRSLGVNAFYVPFARAPSGALLQHKTLSYAASALAQVLLRERRDPLERAEGLFVTSEGEVVEGTASNVFVVEGARVVTPPLESGLLPGTARSRALGICAELGVEVAEEVIMAPRLERADEIFITASTLHVAPVITLEKRPVGGAAGHPLTTRIQRAFEQAVDAEVEGYRGRGQGGD